MSASVGVPFLDDYVVHWYNRYLYSLKYADPRSSKWPLMESPIPTMVLVAIYLSIVKFGPAYMKNRKPFNVKYPLLVYNIAIMALNFYIATELLYCAFYKLNYNWFCQLVDTSDNYYELRIAHALWWYYFSKLVEFMDTFFFILRKKDNQLSFLHVYHHSTMFGLWWIGAKWVPGGSAAPGAIVNCYVHVLMYLYYGLSALGPKVQKYLWWKKYITVIQLIQFVVALSCGTVTLYNGCKFTLWMQWAFVTYACSFIFLFGNFYLHAYIKKSGERKAALKEAAAANGTVKNGYVVNGKKEYPEEINGNVINGYKNGHIIEQVRLRNGISKSHVLSDGCYPTD